MPAPKKYPDEVRERAVRMVFEIREESGQPHGAVARVADKLGVNRETLRNWVKQVEIAGGQRPGTSTGDAQRIAELERENRELRRANEILKAAASFFARELDPRLPKQSSSSTNVGKRSAVSNRSRGSCARPVCRPH